MTGVGKDLRRSLVKARTAMRSHQVAEKEKSEKWVSARHKIYLP